MPGPSSYRRGIDHIVIQVTVLETERPPTLSLYGSPLIVNDSRFLKCFCFGNCLDFADSPMINSDPMSEHDTSNRIQILSLHMGHFLLGAKTNSIHHIFLK